ncbi:MAG: adenylate/guanylate cyclase domain-containing protein [Myxococcales bacterium]|nr:adenylate/guanylate cyclase domain-containing protein [Myxococcales bacterium]
MTRPLLAWLALALPVAGCVAQGQCPPAAAPNAAAASVGRLGSAELADLLRTRTRGNAAEIDRQIESRAGGEMTFMMVDSSGFTRKVQTYGIFAFLASAVQGYDAVLAPIEANHGSVIARPADNLMAVFPTPADAVKAALEMQATLVKRNAGLDDQEQFNISIGIHHGKLIRLADDAFGDAVNVASKLGEDLAAKDEILISREVADRVKGQFKVVLDRSEKVGAGTIEIYKVTN